MKQRYGNPILTVIGGKKNQFLEANFIYLFIY